MFSIRAANPEDASAIAKIHVEGWRTTYQGIVPDSYLASLNLDERRTRWSAALKSRGRVLVAEQNAELIGFIDGGPVRKPVEACDAELYAIYLDVMARRQGIGTALLTELAKNLKKEGFESMAVWVLEANAATRFYERLGASLAGSMQIEIGGVLLTAVAYRWPNLGSLIANPAR